MNKVDCYYYDEESDCCGALSDYSKMPCGLVPCTDDKCGMKEPRQTFECTGKNCPLGFGNGIGRCTATICEYRTKPTNFDKITSSVDALAEFIETISIKDISKERIVEWLLESDEINPVCVSCGKHPREEGELICYECKKHPREEGELICYECKKHTTK